MTFDKFTAETVVLPLIKKNGSYEEIPELFKKQIQLIINLKDFKGNVGELKTTYLPNTPKGIKRLIIVGLGTKDKLSAEQIRRAFGKVGNYLRAEKIMTTGVYFSSIIGKYPESVFEGIYLGNYRFLKYRTKKDELTPELDEIIAIIKPEEKDLIEKAEKYANATALGTNLARNLGNTPSNDATPTYLAEEAQKLEESGIKVTVLDTEAILQEKMNLFLAVAKGSIESDPPKFIIMDYNPKNASKTLCLVGKGITFDTGGISIKPSDGMERMKFDMSGAGLVIGAMKTIGLTKPNIRVVGLVPATPNVPDANAYRPGDIITSRSGLKVEIISTDAEGRNLLADALDFAKKYDPDMVMDFATLTGSMSVALGQINAGYFLNENAEKNPELSKIIHIVGRKSGDYVWQMPLDEEYFERLKSPYADFKHTGGRPGGAVTAAMFLKQFTDYPWAHFDIAGVAYSEDTLGGKTKRYYNPTKGANGFGVRLIAEFIRKWSSNSKIL